MFNTVVYISPPLCNASNISYFCYPLQIMHLNSRRVSNPSVPVFFYLLTQHLEMEQVADYRNLSDRLESFESWPSSKAILVTKLAEAGFYYTTLGDIVACPYCNIEGYHWEPEDDPKSDHASWSPTCPFIINGGDTGTEYEPWDIIENRPDSEIEVPPLQIESEQQPREEYPSYAVLENVVPEVEQVSSPRQPADVQEKDLCKICYSSIIQVLVIPCGHLAFCLKCSPSLDKCPLCRQTIWNKVRAYIP